MKPHEAVGYSMLQTTAITAITSTRIYHGLRPDGTTTPCINFYALPGRRRWGIESTGFSINCRAEDPATASNLARKVSDLFGGTSGTGIYGSQSSFTVMRAWVEQEQGLIPETDDRLYNAPVDIVVVNATSTVS